MMYQPISISRNNEDSALYRNQQRRSRSSAAKAYARKVQVQRQRRMLLFIGMAFVLGIILTFFVVNTSAKAVGSDQASENYKYYKEVYIESGDTLWSIAEQYTDGTITEIHRYIEEVRTINSLSKYETLKSGSYITIPYYSNEYLY